MRILALALLVLGCPGTASADLVVVGEEANLEVMAASSCPEDVPPEPDLGKHFVPAVVGTSPDLLAEMTSTCGTAEMAAHLAVTASTGLIAGSLGTTTFLDMHGGGRTQNTSAIRFRVDAPTAYTFACSGNTLETGTPDQSSMQVRLSGGTIDHHVEFEDAFDREWSGVFEPGIEYTLDLHAGGQRDTRSVGDQYLFMDGRTERTIAFTLSFAGEVVESGSASLGHMKARY
jgi:hypothetical protein